MDNIENFDTVRQLVARTKVILRDVKLLTLMNFLAFCLFAESVVTLVHP